MNKKLLQSIEALFFEKLQFKTGWGRNEVMAAYHEAQREAMLELLDAPAVQVTRSTGLPPMPEQWPDRPATFTTHQVDSGDKPPFDVEDF